MVEKPLLTVEGPSHSHDSSDFNDLSPLPYSITHSPALIRFDSSSEDAGGASALASATVSAMSFAAAPNGDAAAADAAAAQNADVVSPSASSMASSMTASAVVDDDGQLEHHQRLEREIGEAIGFGDSVVVGVDGHVEMSSVVNGRGRELSSMREPEPELAVCFSGPDVVVTEMGALSVERDRETNGQTDSASKEERAMNGRVELESMDGQVDLVSKNGLDLAANEIEEVREKGEMESSSKDDLKDVAGVETPPDLNSKASNLILDDERAKQNVILMREEQKEQESQPAAAVVEEPRPEVEEEQSVTMTEEVVVSQTATSPKKKSGGSGEGSPSKKAGVNGSASAAGNTGFLRAARAGNMDKMKEFMKGGCISLAMYN